MNLRFQAADRRSESFKEYDRLFRQLYDLERTGNGESDEAESVRGAMEWLYRRLSKEEIGYFKSLLTREDAASDRPSCTGKDVLSSDVEIKGSIKCPDQLFIDGKVEGEIISNGVLTIGENADIRDEIKAKLIIIFGKVSGNIAAAERCELKSKCIFQGDLQAARLVVEDGATFIGKSQVTSELRLGPFLPENKQHVRHSLERQK